MYRLGGGRLIEVVSRALNMSVSSNSGSSAFSLTSLSPTGATTTRRRASLSIFCIRSLTLEFRLRRLALDATSRLRFSYIGSTKAVCDLNSKADDCRLNPSCFLTTLTVGRVNSKEADCRRN